MTSLCIVVTHPIQYYTPWFRALDERNGIKVRVHYGRLPDEEAQGRGFGTAFSWDIPLLKGYEWSVSRSNQNVSSEVDVESLYSALRRADAVLVTGWHDPFLVRATAVGRLLGLPLLVRGDSNALGERVWYKRLLHRGYLTAFDRCLAVGEANAAFYVQHGVEQKRLHWCRHFVDNSRFDQQYQEQKDRRSALRRQFNIPEGATSFLFAGKFVEKKHPEDLLFALEQTEPLLTHGLFVGDGPLADELQARASQNKVPVTFTGFLNQTEIGKAYTAADVIVLPSDYGETWGLVINEAMIFECPALVSDRVGCGPDLVDDGETGYKVPFGNSEMLAQRMRSMTESPKRRRHMGERARERVLADYSIEGAVEGTVEALRAATGS